jgi:hypothetical protein
MPLNRKGKKILAAMQSEYGSDKGTRVFYASERSGTIKGVKIMAKRRRRHGTKKHSVKTLKSKLSRIRRIAK